MGSAKEQIFENMSSKSDKILAEYLGISTGELSELDYEIDEDTSDEGVVYGTYLKFSENSPREILDKMGVEKDNRIEVDMSIFHEPDEED